MMKYIRICILLLCSTSLFAQHQVNFQLFGQKAYPDSCLSSIWGYSSTTKEYAIVGKCDGVSIVDITVPALPEVAFVPDVNSIWRELKTYSHYAYAVTEGGSGLLIMDLSDIDNGNVSHYTFNITNNETITNVHTLFIDEFGVCYLFGASQYPNGSGYIALDLNANPLNPTFLGSFGDFYIHDAYVENNIMYAGAILDGYAAILDVSNKANPTVLSTVITPSNFTHNAWINSNKSVMYTTDEVRASFVTSYDITDPTFPKLLGSVRPSADSTAIPHNVHVLNDNWLAVAHYNMGIALIDAHKPENMVYTAFYDTFPWNDSCCFEGVWGIYPYFASGKWVASDRTTGLWVVKPQFQRAAYLEGTVKDSLTGSAISNAKVRIDNVYFQDTARTYIDGGFKTGILESGQFSVTYSADGYISKTETLTLLSTFTTTRHVKLLKNQVVSNSENAKNVLEVYPNPATQTLFIKNLPINASFKILSSDGKFIMAGSESSIDIQSLANGLYIIMVQTSDSQYRTTFIKQ